MMVDQSMRRRSPSGRRWSRDRDKTDDYYLYKEKERCKSRGRVTRAFLKATPFLLLISIGILCVRTRTKPSLVLDTQDDGRELNESPNMAEHAVVEWTMPSSTSTDLTKDLLSLKWDKSSLTSLKEFIAGSKAMVTSHLADERELWKALHDLHNSTSPTIAVVIKKVPIDPDIPPTPTDGSKTLHKSTDVAEAMLLALGELTGSKVVGYSSEVQYSNPWVHEGFPREGVGSALTAAHELSYHQDMSYQDSAPDILGLYCLREGHDVNLWTTILDVRAILAQLPEETIQILRQPRFRIQTSNWVDSSRVASQEQGRPILHGCSLHLPVQWENMIGLDEQATEALTLLQDTILASKPHKIHFEPGVLVFLHNQRAVHGRTAYKNLKFDGGDRVVNRAYFRKQLSLQQEQTRII